MFPASIDRAGGDWAAIFSMTIVIVMLLSAVPSTAMDFLNCQMSLEPSEVKAKPMPTDALSDIPLDEFRCEATLPESLKETFSYPVFDVTFEARGLQEMYVLRDRAECTKDMRKCWKDFHLSGDTLRSLIQSSSAKLGEAMTHINYTCVLADTSSNRKKTIRCNKVGRLLLPRVLAYGQECASQDNWEKGKLSVSEKSNRMESMDRCGRDLACLPSLSDSDRFTCRCKPGYIPYKMTLTNTRCLQMVKLWGECNFAGQCQASEPNSTCELDASRGHKVCKCLQGYESRVKHNGASEKEFMCMASGDTTGTRCPPPGWGATTEGVVYKHQHLGYDTATSQNLQAKLKLMNMSTIAVFILLGVLIASAIIVAIVLRYKNYGLLRMQQQNGEAEKKACNGSGKSAPLLEAMNKLKQIEDDQQDEDVQIAIDNDSSLHYDNHTDETDSQHQGINHHADATMGSALLNAKQSIV